MVPCSLLIAPQFGLLVCKPGQKDENQWYQNSEISPELNEFLLLLGDRIILKGWKRFAGGLDTNAVRPGRLKPCRDWPLTVHSQNLTGTHALYTMFRDVRSLAFRRAAEADTCCSWRLSST